MKLLINKPVRGYVNRGKEKEFSILYAGPEQKVDVIFNNTKIDKEGNLTGHYICTHIGEDSFTVVDESLYFAVFPSQVALIIEENNEEEENNNDNTNKTTIEDDPFSTLLSEDDEN